VIVNEAGGKMTDLEGGKLTLDTRSVLATNSVPMYQMVTELLGK
jgi:fructose-1,6-bisphosphatase/inositol monophosphatase family enzyme